MFIVEEHDVPVAPVPVVELVVASGVALVRF
jgi:hypothetical protein